jgi:hypothetical protein
MHNIVQKHLFISIASDLAKLGHVASKLKKRKSLV